MFILAVDELEDSLELELANGHVINLRNEANQPETIERQEGETIRGMDELAASTIERQMSAGQPEIIEDRTEQIQMSTQTPPESGCQTHSHSFSLISLLALMLWGLYRKTLKEGSFLSKEDYNHLLRTKFPEVLPLILEEQDLGLIDRQRSQCLKNLLLLITKWIPN